MSDISTRAVVFQDRLPSHLLLHLAWHITIAT